MVYQDLRNFAILEWERRHNGYGPNKYKNAPIESSLTKLLMEMVDTLATRLHTLEMQLGPVDNKKPTEPSGTVGFSKSGCTSCEISDCTCFQNRCECDQ